MCDVFKVVPTTEVPSKKVTVPVGVKVEFPTPTDALNQAPSFSAASVAL